MAARGRARAYEAVVAAIKGITGQAAGYWHDLDRQVFSKLVRPEDGGDVPGVYVCVPLVGTAPVPEVGERGLITVQWNLAIYGFVTEQDEELGATSPVDLLHLWEDLARALTTDGTFGGTCQDSALVPGGSEQAAILPVDDYGELVFLLRLMQQFSAADLGPLAT